MCVQPSAKGRVYNCLLKENKPLVSNLDLVRMKTELCATSSTNDKAATPGTGGR